MITKCKERFIGEMQKYIQKQGLGQTCHHPQSGGPGTKLGCWSPSVSTAQNPAANTFTCLHQWLWYELCKPAETHQKPPVLNLGIAMCCLPGFCTSSLILGRYFKLIEILTSLVTSGKAMAWIGHLVLEDEYAHNQGWRCWGFLVLLAIEPSHLSLGHACTPFCWDACVVKYEVIVSNLVYT